MFCWASAFSFAGRPFGRAVCRRLGRPSASWRARRDDACRVMAGRSRRTAGSDSGGRPGADCAGAAPGRRPPTWPHFWQATDISRPAGARSAKTRGGAVVVMTGAHFFPRKIDCRLGIESCQRDVPKSESETGSEHAGTRDSATGVERLSGNSLERLADRLFAVLKGLVHDLQPLPAAIEQLDGLRRSRPFLWAPELLVPDFLVRVVRVEAERL